MPKVAELGLAEFISLLVAETSNAIVTAILEQEKRLVELEQEALLTQEDMRKQLPEDFVRMEMIRLFPDSKGREGKSAIDVGEPYRVATDRDRESPAILARSGYQMQKEDIDKGPEGRPTVSRKGYDNIVEAIREALASRQLRCLQAVLSKGIPRVYVDNGRISVKLTMRLHTAVGDKPSSETASRPCITRVLVQPINISRPEVLALKTDVISEMEIVYKTVVP